MIPTPFYAKQCLALMRDYLVDFEERVYNTLHPTTRDAPARGRGLKAVDDAPRFELRHGPHLNFGHNLILGIARIRAVFLVPSSGIGPGQLLISN